MPTSPMHSAQCEWSWLGRLLGSELPPEGGSILCHGHRLIMLRGLLRDVAVIEPGQRQTSDTFAFKWGREDTYSSAAVEEAIRAWTVERYGNIDLSGAEVWERFGEAPLVLDAGCGAGLTASLLIGDSLHRLRYVGVDISEAVDVAARRFARAKLPGCFMQADLCKLPFPEAAFDFILAEGALHHTPSTRGALLSLAKHLRPGGGFGFYVYAKKAPIREFTDDFIREQVRSLPPREAWDSLMPLTKLGRALGELGVTVAVPEAIELLGIPAGEIDIQRLFYWFICKMYYRPDFSLDEMNHVNFDWFTPIYSHRQTPEEVRGWCDECGLVIEHMKVEQAGITTFAIKR
jgi:arsenite methyltransferase